MIYPHWPNIFFQSFVRSDLTKFKVKKDWSGISAAEDVSRASWDWSTERKTGVSTWQVKSAIEYITLPSEIYILLCLFCNDFHRLLEQLSDLEKDREDLGEEEYAEMRQDTLEQVKAFFVLNKHANL